MTIETERLILRPWRESDAAALFKYAGDPDVGPIAGWPPHKSVEDSLEVIRTVFAAPEVYAVVLKDTGEPVGSCGIMFSDGLHSADMQRGEAEIGRVATGSASPTGAEVLYPRLSGFCCREASMIWRLTRSGADIMTAMPSQNASVRKAVSAIITPTVTSSRRSATDAKSTSIS